MVDLTGPSNREPLDDASWVRGALDEPLIEDTIPAVLKQTVTRNGERLAAVFSEQNVRWTYNEFDSEVDRLASGLHALGLKKGERVGICSPNRYEWLLT